MEAFIKTLEAQIKGVNELARRVYGDIEAQKGAERPVLPLDL